MGKENYCTVGKMKCNRTMLMSCGGCPTAVEACTAALSKKLGNNTNWRNIRHASTFSSETLTVFDNRGQRLASATVRNGNLTTTDGLPGK